MSDERLFTVDELHKLIDPLWESGIVTRSAAYAMLAAHLGRPVDSMHTGLLNGDSRQKVVAFVKAFQVAHGLYRIRHAGGVRDVRAPLSATLGQRLLDQETAPARTRGRR